MKKKLTIIISSALGIILFISYLVFSVVHLTNKYSGTKEDTTMAVINFDLIPRTPETQSDDKSLSDADVVSLTPKDYRDGENKLIEKPKRGEISYSSIFKKNNTPTNHETQNNTTQTPNNSAALSEAFNLETHTPPTNYHSKSSADNKAYEELEADIQTFYQKPQKNKRPTKKQSVNQPEAQTSPESELQRKKRRLQEGFTITTEKSPQSKTENIVNVINVATRGKSDVANGESIKLRVLETGTYNGITIPKNTIIDGRIHFSGSNRVNISVTALYVNSQQYDVKLRAFDLYGQLGLPLTIDKNLNTGTEETIDAVDRVARSSARKTLVGQILYGVTSSIRSDGQKTITVLDGQKLILKE